jgi:hypothetical protein
MQHGRAAFIWAVGIFTCSIPAFAQSTGLEDFVGARAGQAENGLRVRGWQFVRAEQGDDRSYTYWWNASRRQCVTIATMDGRYSSITPSPSPDCRQSNAAPMPSQNYRPPSADYDRSTGDRDQVMVDGRPVNIALICFGDGRKDGLATGTMWRWNRDRDRYEYETYTQNRPEVFDASLMVQLWDGGGRIRLPKSLIPPINSRGSSGWWALDDVRVTRDTITASYRLNGLNKPRLTIDRRMGRISVQGFSNYAFRGTCDPVGDDRRRF